MLNTKAAIKSIIFDLDGTLIDSSEDIISTLIETLKENNIEVDAATKLKIGPPLGDLVIQAAPHITESLKQKIITDFRALYFNSDLPKTKPYSHVIELMKKIKDIGLDSYIATYKPKLLSDKIMKREFKGLYKDIFSPSEVENFSDGKTKADILRLLLNKWDLNPEESIMVGDTKSDIVSAKDVKIFSIGVEYGYGHPEDFVHANKIVNSTKDLYDFIIELCTKLK